MFFYYMSQCYYVYSTTVAKAAQKGQEASAEGMYASHVFIAPYT